MAGKRTPLYQNHVTAGARLVDFAGWDMPQQYTSVRNEQEAVRTAAGLFDVSHMGRYEIRGPAAGEFLQGLVTNDLGRLRLDQAQYNLLCLPDGGIVDDLVVYRRAGGWWLVVNAANREKDMAWLRQHERPGTEIVDHSSEVSLLALQGPRAAEMLPVEGVDLTAVPSFGVGSGRVAGVPSVIARTGYTGEDGFELFVPTSHVASVWDALVEAGATPCGLAARDVCRLEAGLRLYGSDMDQDTNPYEAGLGWTVKLGKGEFVGSQALERIKAEGPRRQLVGLGASDRTIPRHGSAVSLGASVIGTVTSGTYSFWLRRGIAMAMIDAGSAAVGTTLTVEARNGTGRAEVVTMPFYRGSARRAVRPVG
ncbi:MAG TPA: glycine cleavage system aminomethyltransferase GcvT [Candidatus Dormibacteraeota bacterium]|nr:glycine cleavage system aminomethyltransferase GcvT [Candidatus Dormibacteraeota bacterium]